MLRAWVELRQPLGEHRRQRFPDGVRQVGRDLTLGDLVSLAPLQFDDLLHPLGLVDRPPEELRHGDLVDFLPGSLQPGRQ